MAILKYFNQDTQEWNNVSLGQQGVQGPVGPAGISAYEEAVAGGFVGTEQEWLDSLKSDLNASEIKSRYESNLNTNAYTDAEKSKLATIEAGAEVNVQADWNATSGASQVLNKPTLGTAAATNTTDYATAAQGILADNSVQVGDYLSKLKWSSTNW